MGAVISSIANAFMLLVNGVAALLQAIIGAIAAVLFGIATVLTCGRAGGPTPTTGTYELAGPVRVGGGMPSSATATGRRRFGFRRRPGRMGGAVAPTGGVGSVPLDDAGYYPPGVAGNGVPLTMESGVCSGAGGGAMYGPGGPGPTPYGPAMNGLHHGGVPPCARGDPVMGTAYY